MIKKELIIELLHYLNLPVCLTLVGNRKYLIIFISKDQRISLFDETHVDAAPQTYVKITIGEFNSSREAEIKNFIRHQANFYREIGLYEGANILREIGYNVTYIVLLIPLSCIKRISSIPSRVLNNYN
jgi:hypothetical protein